jgi:hypothetical protein
MLQPSHHGQVDRMEVDMGTVQDKRVVVIGAGIVGASLAYLSIQRAVQMFIGLANVIKIAQPGLSTRFDFHQGH